MQGRVAILVVFVALALYGVNRGWLDDLLIFHPERFHGHGKSSNYFEGWYFKMVTEDEKHSLVVIVGIFFGNTSDSPKSHSFIMTIVDSHTTSKYNFGVDQFVASHNSLFVRVGENSFSDEGLTLNLVPKPGDDAKTTFKGQLQFKDMVQWPVTLVAPGVMGWYSYVPTLECWHGVVSMHHKIKGTVTINQTEVLFDSGKGYIEKDWGYTFPQTWIWFQTNHFSSSPETSIFLSIGSVPWKSYSFPGFLVGFWHNNKLHMMTTWSGANFNITSFSGTTAKFVVSNTEFELSISIYDTSDGVVLYGPRNGEMIPFVRESVTCHAEVKFSRITKEVLFEDTGNNAGCEFVGNIEWMISNL